MIVFPFWLLTAFLALMPEPVSVCAGAAYAVYFRLRPLYAVLPGVAAIFDLAGGRVWMLCVDFHGRFDCGCSRAF